MSASNSIQPTRNLRRRFAAIMAVLATLLVAVPLQPAAAASSITGPSNLVCEKYDNKLSVNAPRVWASSRTEQVIWTVQVQRWNGAQWYIYSTNYFYASFNVYGQNVTGWTSGWYNNSTLNVPVWHSGLYRMASDVRGVQGGVYWLAYVSGGGSCRVY
ncbi:hypothetical protein ACU18_17650 [Arthrobacter sp. ZBG10]|uniref:hypothetical protein n=1 Tax=Arthrobacter sp. ZBG10 TaxID=1676590 RepID=UPI00068281A5|nr:hypothetical protein [Arthrobacter sp. ZBG10]KNH15293.1 hypothetical protein ACU18_17650 [Arthrobacter sp. ZBG10]